MSFTVDNIISIITVLTSALAIYLSIKKQDKEGKNIDADTINKLYDTIGEQEERYSKLKRETVVEQDEKYRKLKLEDEKRYCELKKEFEDYKKAMNAQFAILVNENARLRAWARALVKQLEDAQIIPVQYE